MLSNPQTQTHTRAAHCIELHAGGRPTPDSASDESDASASPARRRERRWTRESACIVATDESDALKSAADQSDHASESCDSATEPPSDAVVVAASAATATAAAAAAAASPSAPESNCRFNPCSDAASPAASSSDGVSSGGRPSAVAASDR